MHWLSEVNTVCQLILLRDVLTLGWTTTSMMKDMQLAVICCWFTTQVHRCQQKFLDNPYVSAEVGHVRVHHTAGPADLLCFCVTHLWPLLFPWLAWNYQVLPCHSVSTLLSVLAMLTHRCMFYCARNVTCRLPSWICFRTALVLGWFPVLYNSCC